MSEPKKPESQSASIAKGIIIAFLIIGGMMFLLGVLNGATGG